MRTTRCSRDCNGLLSFWASKMCIRDRVYAKIINKKKDEAVNLVNGLFH